MHEFVVKKGFEKLRVSGVSNGILGELSQSELELLYIAGLPCVTKKTKKADEAKNAKG